jgi:hypothetical protein
MSFSKSNANLILSIHRKEVDKILNDDRTSLVFKDRLIGFLDEMEDVESTLSQAGSLLNIIRRIEED